MRNLETAVIPVGGTGTRFFPLAKSVPKYMYPVLNRPVLDLMIDNCLDAGIEHLVFVVAEDDNLLREYVTEDTKLAAKMCDLGKYAIYQEKVEPLHKRAKIDIINQRWDGRYGTATALLPAREILDEDEPFYYAMGDNFIWRTDGSDITDMHEAMRASFAKMATMVSEVNSFAELKQHAAAVTLPDSPDGFQYLDELDEKPTVDYPVRLASVGRHILTPDIFDIIEHQHPDLNTGEYFLPDSLNIYSQDNPVLVHTMKGLVLDCGTPENLLATNITMARITGMLTPKQWRLINTRLKLASGSIIKAV